MNGGQSRLFTEWEHNERWVMHNLVRIFSLLDFLVCYFCKSKQTKFCSVSAFDKLSIREIRDDRDLSRIIHAFLGSSN
jgi:hypothetical protein